MIRRNEFHSVLFVLAIVGGIVGLTRQGQASVRTAQGETARPHTVADLVAQGGQQLSTDQIRELVLGKTLRVVDLRNLAKYDVYFGEDGTRTIIGAVSTVSAEGGAPNNSLFEIRDGQLHTTLLDGSSFSSRVYRLGSRHFGVRSDEDGLVHYELLGVIEGRITIASLLTRGAVALNKEELTRLLVGKTLTIRHLVTGEVFQISYSKKGRRKVKSPLEDQEAFDSKYKIQEGGRLDIWEDHSYFWARIYRLGDLYFGARSNEEGFVSYEILSSR